jgi:two-component system NtrC family sensor kinase
MKTLIVEDNADDRRILRYNLERHGCDVMEAADGREGLEAARAHKPELIISDALMPRMDGYQFLRSVKTDEALKTVPFIFYSAVYTGQKEMKLALSLGADAFIIKPKEPEELWDEIKNILENCKLGKKPVASAPLIEEEEEYLRKYGTIVATKLEEKILELDRAVTERKQAEESLQEQKIFAEYLIENSAVATFVLDARHKVVIWNKACEELTGVPAAEMLGTDNQWKPFYEHKRPVLADIVIDGDFAKLPELYSTHAKSTLTPNALHAEGWYGNLNGRDRYILFDAAPISIKKGELTAAIETLQDITERKRAEESLAESESKLRTLTNTAADVIVMIDAEDKITYWNPAGKRILGYSAEEVLGRDLTLIIPHRYREAHKKAFNKFVETGRVAKGLRKQYEVAAIKKDGTEVPVELSISGLRVQGKCYSVGIIRDVSERRKLEDQLRHSQKMEAIGQLAGGVAHDFNNILTAIIGYGSILHRKMNKDDPLRINVEHMLESADRAAHLTYSLLAFSRKQILNPRHVDLNDVIARVEKLLRRVIGEDIELKTSLKKGPVTVNADSGQIEQVLMNLATNARDAMPRDGSFTIETDTLVLDDAFARVHGYGEAGAYALVTVTDTGTGMDEEMRKKIFEPFFTTKEVGRGTGLGLSIVYGIIKQHRGFINVYSEPGKGTAFKIYLPLLNPEIEKNGMPAAVPEEEPPRGTETVLVAEDDEGVRKLSRAVLEESGYTVIEAKDGADAVDKFMKNRDAVRLVILDMIMPKKSGKEAYEEIKRTNPAIKTIFVSGYTADKLQREGVLEEGVELIMKPLGPRDFLRKVREVLDR